MSSLPPMGFRKLSLWAARVVIVIALVLLAYAALNPPRDPPAERQMVPRHRAKERFMKNRLVPSFIIVGAQKAGTTSLYNYLLRHPQVLPLETTLNVSESEKPLRATGSKEIRFFGTGMVVKGVDRYLKYFPDRSKLDRLPNLRPVIVGEASPNYMFTLRAAMEIIETFPRVRIIALLRNPADRANSQYYHSLLANNKTVQPIEDYLNIEERFIQTCLARFPQILESKQIVYHAQFIECHRNMTQEFLQNASTSKRAWNLQLLIRGIYLPQIIPYLKLFPREQVMFIKSEDFYADPNWHMENISRFLGISSFEWDDVVKFKFNFGERNIVKETAADIVLHPELPAHLRTKIERIMRPFNKRLQELIGISWEETPTSEEDKEQWST